ncbi:hypothetical protein CJF42_06100 [Pseudoalteromonas sp. NBT06-2]|uniref:hypothetical protein n=1 Tax=Pseudoalteromonas sp. NBT06-2 TaxID=2025950 RepID=UPI000BA50D90|nr:hypothetical protein [Pseudoalteromonas sp. NBT06-2]PAJ75220.1 hypothetical protein CJF42_06100 [Pseudoalteromonas sp. NBT06-2]
MSWNQYNTQLLLADNLIKELQQTIVQARDLQYQTITLPLEEIDLLLHKIDELQQEVVGHTTAS